MNYKEIAERIYTDLHNLINVYYNGKFRISKDNNILIILDEA